MHELKPNGRKKKQNEIKSNKCERIKIASPHVRVHVIFLPVSTIISWIRFYANLVNFILLQTWIKFIGN